MSVVAWHDLECGSYREDLPLWRELATGIDGRVLDVGAGTGRVTLDLAGGGLPVVALDLDAELLAALAQRAGTLPVETVVADARDFRLAGTFPLIIAPMQTAQLLGGPAGRARFLATTAAHLAPGGRLAVALSEPLEPWDQPGTTLPLPDVSEEDGVVRSSQPVRVTEDAAGWTVERIRLTSAPGRDPQAEQDFITLERVGADELEAEAAGAGLHPAGRRFVAETEEYVGTTVVILGHG